MVLCGRIIAKVNAKFSLPSTNYICRLLSSQQAHEFVDFECKRDVDAVIAKVLPAGSENEVFQSLAHEFGCDTLRISHASVGRLLHRFEDDWKSALGVFRWAESCSGYKPSPQLYDKLVDILGKMKQMEKMKALLQEMNESHLVSLNTISKVMRRFAGAGDWKEAAKTFDELEAFGLEKNTESLNLLLDTLCKAHKVEQARTIFLEMQSHITPNENTFNIFVHGWCKIGRAEEAHWTIQEMKGHGVRPSVISYSTIIQFYCSQGSFYMAEEILKEMESEQCPPNVVTFTTIMHSLTKAEDFDEAIRISERAKLSGCKLDTQFYNALIHSLGKAGRMGDAIHTFTSEMPENNINPNTSTYNTMIAMFCHHRQVDWGERCLRDLENSPHCKPDVQSFYPLLKAYFRKGKADQRWKGLLDKMVKKHHLCLDLATYSLLIHGLCRAGKCEEAYGEFQEMVGQNIKPRYVTCSLLLQEIREKNMYDAVEMVEEYMKKLKSSP